MNTEASIRMEKRTDKGSTTIKIEKITNGYLIIEDKETKDSKGNYKWECTKTYSKENPLTAKVDMDILEKFVEESF